MYNTTEFGTVHVQQYSTLVSLDEYMPLSSQHCELLERLDLEDCVLVRIRILKHQPLLHLFAWLLCLPPAAVLFVPVPPFKH